MGRCGGVEMGRCGDVGVVEVWGCGGGVGSVGMWLGGEARDPGFDLG